LNTMSSAASIQLPLEHRTHVSMGTISIHRNEDFRYVSVEMERLTARRESLIIDAFMALERYHTLIAELLVLHSGSRAKAARWMCAHQKAFDGRTGYDLISEGEVEAVWDEVAQLSLGGGDLR
jgi:hypothetical protein